MKPPISLYFHIPFCTQKCSYCHFFVLPDKPQFKEQLLLSLQKEYALRKPIIDAHEVISIYFGGGTPALMGAKAIEKILSWIDYDHAKTEITLEANPENITKELMQAYANVGINRVSVGLQALDDGLLIRLNRIHDSKKAMESIYSTFDAGIKNISVDLMYDLPGQTLPIWEQTLDQVRSLPVTHLSLYNLTIEPHTAFFKYRRAIEDEMPDSETSLAMYNRAQDFLPKMGLVQYEISAFAKNNLISIHNVGYWTGRTFLGLGPSAFSYWNGRRFRNVANLNQYSRALEVDEFPIDFDEELSKPAKVRELLAINLRLLSGVNIANFQKIHGQFEEDVEKSLLRLCEEEFLVKHESNMFLTQKGILFYDTVASEII